jgi:MscS family membrane protein
MHKRVTMFVMSSLEYLLVQLLEDPYFASLTILVGSIFVAALTNFIFTHWLKSLVKRTKTKVDDQLIAILRRPLGITIVLVGAHYSLLPLDLSTESTELLWTALLTISFILWGATLTQVVQVFSFALKRHLEHTHSVIDSDLIPFINNITRVVVVGLVALLILDNWGIDITPLLASAGVIGVAVAFAAKDTVANLFGGVSVFIDRPYRVGDYVIVNDQYRGEVTEIGMRSTKIRTRDNVLVTVPNLVMVTNAVVNETGTDPHLRVRLALGVAYESDLEKVEQALLETAAGHSEVSKHPAPTVRFRQFGDSAIELELLVTVSQPANRGRIVHELIKAINVRFKKQGIKIPFPQREIYISK